MFRPNMTPIEQKKDKILKDKQLEKQERSKIFRCIVDDYNCCYYTDLNGNTHKEYKAISSIERKQIRTKSMFNNSIFIRIKTNKKYIDTEEDEGKTHCNFEFDKETHEPILPDTRSLSNKLLEKYNRLSYNKNNKEEI